MEYKITKEQKESIVKAFFDINAPVQLYSVVMKMLNELPEIVAEKKTKE